MKTLFSMLCLTFLVSNAIAQNTNADLTDFLPSGKQEQQFIAYVDHSEIIADNANLIVVREGEQYCYCAILKNSRGSNIQAIFVDIAKTTGSKEEIKGFRLGHKYYI